MKSGNVAVNPRAHEPGAARRDAAAGAVSRASTRQRCGRRRSGESDTSMTNRQRCSDRATHATTRTSSAGGAWPLRAARTTPFAIRRGPASALGEFANSTRGRRGPLRSMPRPGRGAAWARHAGPTARRHPVPVRRSAGGVQDELARIITLEQGKALAEAVGEVGRAAAEARFMAGEASRPVGPRVSERASRGRRARRSRSRSAWSRRSARGTFPVVTPVRKIAPALAWGNTVVFKPASLTPWSAVYLMQLLERAGRAAGRRQSGHRRRAQWSARR